LREGSSWQVASRFRYSLAIGLVLSVAGHGMALLGLAKSEVTPGTVSGLAAAMHVTVATVATPTRRGSDIVGRSIRDSNIRPARASPQALPKVGPQGQFAHVGAEYIPSAQLIQGPVIQGSVDILRPETDLENAEVTLYLTLFINEHGLVDRVEVDDLERHPSFAEAAMGAFSAARFNPGQRNGRAVKSSMRIEVLFEPVEHSSPRE
jgi:hypothetical protein